MINVAQIGVGYWGPNLLRNLISSDECAVKAVVELSEERRAFVGKLYPGVVVTDKIETVMSDENVNGVVIATPVKTHFALAMSMLEAGKHILVEKPMATTVDEVREIGRLAEKRGLVAMVSHTFLYNEAVRYVKQFIDSGDLGDVRYIYSQRVNLGRIRSDVDALWNLAPHDVSIIQYLLGDPEPSDISRRGMAYVQKGIDDVVFLNIAYPEGMLANIHVSWLDPHKIRRMTVVGSKKMVVYDDIANEKIAIFDKGIDRMAILGEHMDFDDPMKHRFNHRSGDVVLPKIEWQEPLRTEVKHFIDCTEGKANCMTGVEHAEKVVRILGG